MGDYNAEIGIVGKKKHWLIVLLVLGEEIYRNFHVINSVSTFMTGNSLPWF